MFKNFFRKYATVLAIAAFSIFIGVSSYMGTLSDLPKIEAVTFKIEGACSATLVDNPFTPEEDAALLTAKHCLTGMAMIPELAMKDKFKITNEKEPDKVFEASVTAISSVSDLALLKFDGSAPESRPMTIPFHGEQPQFGDRVTSLSYPAMSGKTITECLTSYVEVQEAFKDVSETALFTKADCKLIGGSSGSAIFVKTWRGWKIVGVLTGALSGTATFYTPVNEITSFIQNKDVIHDKDLVSE